MLLFAPRVPQAATLSLVLAATPSASITMAAADTQRLQRRYNSDPATMTTTTPPTISTAGVAAGGGAGISTATSSEISAVTTTTSVTTIPAPAALLSEQGLVGLESAAAATTADFLEEIPSTLAVPTLHIFMTSPPPVAPPAMNAQAAEAGLGNEPATTTAGPHATEEPAAAVEFSPQPGAPAPDAPSEHATAGEETPSLEPSDELTGATDLGEAHHPSALETNRPPSPFLLLPPEVLYRTATFLHPELLSTTMASLNKSSRSLFRFARSDIILARLVLAQYLVDILEGPCPPSSPDDALKKIKWIKLHASHWAAFFLITGFSKDSLTILTGTSMTYSESSGDISTTSYSEASISPCPSSTSFGIASSVSDISAVEVNRQVRRRLLQGLELALLQKPDCDLLLFDINYMTVFAVHLDSVDIVSKLALMIAEAWEGIYESLSSWWTMCICNAAAHGSNAVANWLFGEGENILFPKRLPKLEGATDEDDAAELDWQTFVLDDRSKAVHAALRNASKLGNEGVLRILVDAHAKIGMNVDVNTCEGYALLEAAERGHNEIVQLLIQACSWPASSEQEVAEQSPSSAFTAETCTRAFESACSCGHEAVVSTLLDMPCIPTQYVDPMTNDGAPLREACRNGHEEVVTELLKPRTRRSNQSGSNVEVVVVDPSIRDYECLTVAANEGHVEVVRALIGFPHAQLVKTAFPESAIVSPPPLELRLRILRSIASSPQSVDEVVKFLAEDLERRNEFPTEAERVESLVFSTTAAKDEDRVFDMLSLSLTAWEKHVVAAAVPADGLSASEITEGNTAATTTSTTTTTTATTPLLHLSRTLTECSKRGWLKSVEKILDAQQSRGLAAATTRAEREEALYAAAQAKKTEVLELLFAKCFSLDVSVGADDEEYSVVVRGRIAGQGAADDKEGGISAAEFGAREMMVFNEPDGAEGFMVNPFLFELNLPTIVEEVLRDFCSG
ncbi:hypothetical protein DFJ73DRAFT_851699 [Zopfochytrium polystomum]|nr:hypothetical protein DFJ73DRAFT_851699 [Zopfochytrium polystomum]